MFGLIGKSLKHSYSKYIHEELFVEKYNLIELNELDAFFTSKKFTGINVTIPFKTEVIKYCDDLSDIAEDSNSVNTIINKDGFLKGYNTDYSGLVFMLKYNNIDLSNKHILILGNGSTSRIVARICNDNNCNSVTIAARNPVKDEINLINIGTLKNTNIIFNTTPVGMYPNNSNSLGIEFSEFKLIECVVDLIYNPMESKLLRAAGQYRIKTVNGLMMLIHQAVKANELFHNRVYSKGITIDLYRKILLKTINFVFIGMPMSGKTHFAKLLSKKYNKHFIDVDWVIEDNFGDTIENIFSKKGEIFFRKLESKNIEDISKRTSLAVSTGGGVIVNPKNMDFLKQNGIIIFLDVPLSMLKRFNPKKRPLLKDTKNLEFLYEERYPLYQKYADIIIQKDSYDSDKTLNKIEVEINEYINHKWTKSE